MRKFVIALLACVAVGTANADERNPLDAKFIVDAGWFFMSTDMRVRVDGDTTGVVGSDLNYDDTFGIGDFDRFRCTSRTIAAPRVPWSAT